MDTFLPPHQGILIKKEWKEYLFQSVLQHGQTVESKTLKEGFYPYMFLMKLVDESICFDFCYSVG